MTLPPTAATKHFLWSLGLFAMAFGGALSWNNWRINARGVVPVMTPKRTPTAPGPGPGDFSYDRARWEQRVPRIAVLAGPHKTASTTLQAFVAGIAAAGAAWEWPYAKDPPFRHLRPPKFYTPLAAIVSGHNVYIEKWAPAAEAHGNMTATEQVAWRAEVAGRYQSYYQHLFRGVLERGKNLVIGA